LRLVQSQKGPLDQLIFLPIILIDFHDHTSPFIPLPSGQQLPQSFPTPVKHRSHTALLDPNLPSDFPIAHLIKILQAQHLSLSRRQLP